MLTRDSAHNPLRSGRREVILVWIVLPDADQEVPMGHHDRFAHLRANLERHRAVTAHRTYLWWCIECQLHQADDSGLCPMCRPAESSARGVAEGQRAS